jgi:hypothetical protein
MAAQSFANIALRLQSALIGESARMGQTPPIVAVLSLDVLKNYWALHPEGGVTFSAFGDSGSAVVQNGPCGAVLWMDPVPDSYRAIFGKFLQVHWGAITDLTRSGYDADHVYNRARAKLYGYRLVRMFLVVQNVNRDHGSSYEMQIGKAERDRSVKIMKLLDGMSELKTLGLPPVKNGLLTQEHYAAARQAATTYGIPVASAEQTLRAMYSRAHPDD